MVNNVNNIVNPSCGSFHYPVVLTSNVLKLQPWLWLGTAGTRSATQHHSAVSRCSTQGAPADPYTCPSPGLRSFWEQQQVPQLQTVHSDWGFWASFAWESWKKDEKGTWGPGIFKPRTIRNREIAQLSSDISLPNTIEVGHKVGSWKQVCRNAAYLPERLSTSCQHLIVFTHPKNVAIDFFESSQRVCLLETTELPSW